MTAATVLARRLPARPLFTATVLLGSFLLFLIQPMLARMLLPRFGGAPNVWNVSMLFYQAMLLAGYLYAHAISRFALRTQLMLHLALFAAAALTLPIGVAAAGLDSMGPAVSLLSLLALSIGPVFLLVAAQAPLMQSWFARADDPAAASPYFLYAASNAGSLLALVVYPLLFEPNFRLGQQAAIWSAGFVLLAGLVALCGVVPADRTPHSAEDEAASWRDRAIWTLLAAVPSGLLLSTTTHLTTDIMAMPLLWVIPLALYLLTFVVAFADGGRIFVEKAQRAAPLVLLLLGAYTFLAAGVIAFLMALTNLVLLLVVALALHGELVTRRPPARQLTDFYIWLSVGGALGGLFSALVAPALFDWVYEHPLLLIAAALLLPARPLSPWLGRIWQSKPGGVLLWVWPVATLAASWWAHQHLVVTDQPALGAPALAFIAAGAVLSIGRRMPFAMHFTALLLALGGWQTLKVSTVEAARTRSFFGIYTVKADSARMIRQLEHGTTLHGVQSLVPGFETTPQSYYSLGSGISEAVTSLPALSGRFAKVGFVGLGAGSLACYAQAGQGWSAFEIDTAVVDIARDDRLFTYLSNCAPDLRIVVGDARLTLGKEAPDSYDLLAIDAFSSDAIPLHLMTREAFDVYGRALKPDGLLVVHISNRHVDLEPVVAAIATDMGWAARVRDFTPREQRLPGINYTRSIWVLLTPTETRMQEFLAQSPTGASGWAVLRTKPGLTPWTDDFASIIPVLRMQ